MKSFTIFSLLGLFGFSGFGQLIDTARPRGFQENKGQIVNQHGNVNDEVLFLLQGNGLNVQLRRGGFSYDCWADLDENSKQSAKRFHRIDIDFEQAGNACIEVVGKSLDYENFYLCGSEVPFVHRYEKVIYKEIYKDIDVEFVFTGNGLLGFEYNFILAPGANPSDIKMRYSGQSSLNLSQNELTIGTTIGVLKESIPMAWTMPGEKMAEVEYILLKKDLVGIAVKEHDVNLAMVIDPVPSILWATYYGGENSDGFGIIGSDAIGNLYLAGATMSATGIATDGTHQSEIGNVLGMNLTDVFVVKLNSLGQRIWGTYYGGEGGESIRDYAITTEGVVICGQSNSLLGISYGNSFQNVYAGNSDGFIASIDENGMMQWATYIGGSESDMIEGVTVSGSDIYFGGRTVSSDYFVSNSNEGLQMQGSSDGILGKFDTNGNLIWSRYFGGSQTELISDVFIADSEIYVVGRTSSEALATTGAYLENLTDNFNIFMGRFELNGDLLYCTYTPIGFQFGITENFIKVANGTAYLYGSIKTDGLGTSEVHQSDFGGAEDGYLVQFSTDLHNLNWFTYFGGSRNDVIKDITFDSLGKTIAVGSTQSADGISTTNALQEAWTPGGGSLYYEDGFIAIFNDTGNLEYGTYYGGNKIDKFSSVYLAPDGALYVAGGAASDNLATSGAYAETNPSPGVGSGLLLKLDLNTLVENLEDFSSSVLVYPNPSAGGPFFVSSQVNLHGYFLLDSGGKVVQTRMNLNTHSIHIETNELSAGIYFLRLISVDGNFVNKKIVVQ